MKIKTQFSKSIFSAALLVGMAAGANAVTVTVDPTTLTSGFMNVFELPVNGGGYVFGSGWGPGDLVSSFAGNTLTLRPNQIGDPNPFWYIGGGGPGQAGNKIMDASLYNETTGVNVGVTFMFTGNVLANTLNGAINPYNGTTYSSVAFIKDFVANFSSFTSTTVALTPGVFNLSLLTSADPTHHIQYGFETIGSDIWATDTALNGGAFTAVIAPVPEPSTLALCGLASLALIRRRKK